MNKNHLYVIIGILVVIIAALVVMNYSKKDTAGTIAIIDDTTPNDSDVIDTEKPKGLPDQAICGTGGYEETPESKVAFEESLTLITGFTKACDGNYYFAFDYVAVSGYNEMSGGDSYSNTNPKIRTFKVDPNLKVKLSNNTEMPISSYVNTLAKSNGEIFNQKNAYVSSASAGVALFKLTITNGILTSLQEMYLP